MSHICFITDTNSKCKVFDISNLTETIISFEEFQTQFNPSNIINPSNGINRCIIKSNLEEYINEKEKLIQINSYNKFIDEKARVELGCINKFQPSNTLLNTIKNCKKKYPMSEYVLKNKYK
jgi:hypothetical protein